MAHDMTRAQAAKEKTRLKEGKAPSASTAMRMVDALLDLLPPDPAVKPYKRVELLKVEDDGLPEVTEPGLPNKGKGKSKSKKPVSDDS